MLASLILTDMTTNSVGRITMDLFGKTKTLQSKLMPLNSKIPILKNISKIYRERSNKDFGADYDIFLLQNIKTDQLFIKKVFKEKNKIKREIKILEKIGYHDNIIGVVHVEIMDQIKRSIIFEYGDGDDLFKEICCYGKMEPVLACNVMIEILKALKYLQYLSIIHRDIKLENIVSFKRQGKIYRIKLIDFGQAIHFRKNHLKNDRVGTIGYMAPEIWLKESHDFAIDMWSSGVVMHLLYTCIHPFNPSSLTYEQIRYFTVEEDFEVKFSEFSEKTVPMMIQSLLQRNAEERPSAGTCLQKLVDHAKSNMIPLFDNSQSIV